ncbi:MAG: S9 family peptidase [Lewinellaceae bacterium]|nr:S9 family peptidase [Saprospiraceae bacterium]MCB9330024.1 S9 family peptidase [Lewinellaceae bacterium]
MKQFLTFLIFAGLFFNACQQPSSTTNTPDPVPPSVFQPDKFSAPRPEKKPKELIAVSGDKRIDNYYWLNERDNPDVVAYLEAENRYADSVLAPVSNLQTALFTEMKGRIKQDDNTVPYLKNGYWYYTRFETGKEYPIYCRKKGSQEAAEEIMLNVNELAAGKAYCLALGLNVSPDNRLLFYVIDYSGRNLFEGQIKDLESGQLRGDKFSGVLAGSSAWANDSQHLFYETKDPVTLRTDQIWRHKIGGDGKSETMVFEEKDETLYLNLDKSKSEQYIFINHGYTQNLETHYLNADDPMGAFQVFRPKEPDFFYYLEHWGDKFLIRTNWDAPNFRLMETPVANTARENWKEVLPHRADVLLEGIEVFQDYLVTNERKGGLDQLRIIRWVDRGEHYLDFGEPTYAAGPMQNPEFNTKNLRYWFSSLKTPGSVFDYDMETRQKTLRKTEPVLGGFDANNYETAFVWATARDGVKVPVSLVRKKGSKQDGSAPCYLVGYGSYGFSYTPGFNRDVISLLDRGFVYAIAHIRGGMEMGYNWYEDGKMMHKMNTFTDFIDCAAMLCSEKYTSSDRIFGSGRSAGGLLMGAVANMAPQQFRGLIAGVPFVDVLTTMSDPSIPLTTGEYTEWGNPAVKAEYEYMKKYSPYDNVKAQEYPNLLVLTSFSDSQVQYFEPAKWVAKLRDMKTDNNALLFKTNMSGSHGGSSGRFERLKERALEYAWMLGLMGVKEDKLAQ